MSIASLRATFFEECEDLLSKMGEGLGRMARPDAPPDMETVHEVFRAVHSIKGGSGAFGLTSLVEFAHVFETVLDLMRSGKLAMEVVAVQALLRAYDVLSDLIDVARDGGAEPPQMAAVLMELDLMAEAGPGGGTEDDVFDFQPLPLELPDVAAPEGGGSSSPAVYSVTLVPTADLFACGHEPAALLRALAELGEVQVMADLAGVPLLSDMDLGRPRLRWTVTLSTFASHEEIGAIFEFVGNLAEVKIAANPSPAKAEGDVTIAGPADQAVSLRAVEVSAPKAASSVQPKPFAAPAAVPAPPGENGATALPMTTTIRVNLDRVDRLINQIGELVIMEAMLAQAVASAGLRDHSDVSTSLDGIKQLAASIQESVMSIRAQPLRPVFQRMERIVREAGDATGKQVRLIMLGEATEVDKTVIERLVDPLTHMLRNSVDHGIEAPSVRAAAGKAPQGVITLSAAHRSGRVVIEVSDDGGGIDRARVRDVAEERGLIPAGTQLAPADIDNLLFLPGFSSKQEVSALSGRGVGLDVVRREIQSLGGRVTIQSAPGEGTTFTIALPLTLAVLEGMLISVGHEIMVLPLASITETIRPTPSQLHALGRTGRVVANRGTLVPIVDLAESFGYPPITDLEAAVLIMVETDEGRHAALAAHAIHDQRQVVIKSLENNYGAVHGISAATILGDGRIALIIDPREIVESASCDPTARPLSAHG
ncbi:chemotaxis protein CheA [Paragemmobacter ruber]|uniref:Chemotaxis protein CheA n=1 Tax=Paragemmobacter ruber TaxID=1985673 RepID=A0ABW9YA88_9RHOB|nr:chemotaxis protein CheA [Rhodobacter ruber]NBE09526.1 chemotaxis protein CheA [Rhodobacter ruber]